MIADLDVGDIENLRSRVAELESNITDMEDTLKSLQKEQRQLEDEMAEIHKRRVRFIVHERGVLFIF